MSKLYTWHLTDITLRNAISKRNDLFKIHNIVIWMKLPYQVLFT